MFELEHIERKVKFFPKSFFPHDNQPAGYDQGSDPGSGGGSGSETSGIMSSITGLFNAGGGSAPGLISNATLAAASGGADIPADIGLLTGLFSLANKSNTTKGNQHRLPNGKIVNDADYKKYLDATAAIEAAADKVRKEAAAHEAAIYAKGSASSARSAQTLSTAQQKIAAASKTKTMIMWAAGGFILVLIIVLVILFIRSRRKKKQTEK